NDANDVRYVEDVAFSMQKLGDVFRGSDAEKALAYYEYGADVRAKYVESIPNTASAKRKADAKARLESSQRIVASARAGLDPGRLASLSNLWWRMRVLDDIDQFTAGARTVEPNPNTCPDAVMEAAKAIVGPSTTASFR